LVSRNLREVSEKTSRGAQVSRDLDHKVDVAEALHRIALHEGASCVAWNIDVTISRTATDAPVLEVRKLLRKMRAPQIP
jgi:hypothetical protein